MRWSFRTNGNYIDFVHTDETSEAVESTVFHLHNTSRCISWSLPSDTTRINFTIDEVKYSNILITDIDFDGTAMDSQDDFETGIEAMFPGYASAAGGLLLSATITLTDAQIKVGPSTEYTIKVSPGVGKYLAPVYASILLDNTAGAYVTGGSAAMAIQVGSIGFGVTVDAAAFESNSNKWLWQVNSSDSSGQPINPTDLENLPIKLVITDFSTNPFTGGNAANTLEVVVFYTEVDL